MDANKFRALVFAQNYAENACWEWRGHRTSDGYTKVYFDGQQIYAHRASYMTFVGPIPTGLQVDHLCRNRACINPQHLEAVTQRENILRGEAHAAVNARKILCIRGHELSISPKGTRYCKECPRLKRLVGFVPKKLDGKPGAHKQTQCKNGHVYDGTEIVYRRGKVCRQCSVIKSRKHELKRKELRQLASLDPA